jgi:hypothetical protein
MFLTESCVGVTFGAKCIEHECSSQTTRDSAYALYLLFKGDPRAIDGGAVGGVGRRGLRRVPVVPRSRGAAGENVPVAGVPRTAADQQVVAARRPAATAPVFALADREKVSASLQGESAAGARQNLEQLLSLATWVDIYRPEIRAV